MTHTPNVAAFSPFMPPKKRITNAMSSQKKPLIAAPTSCTRPRRTTRLSQKSAA